jgi:hypothetical protein
MTRRGQTQTFPDVGAVNPPTAEQTRRAALVICDRATDIDDARDLVDMLIDRTWL